MILKYLCSAAGLTLLLLPGLNVAAEGVAEGVAKGIAEGAASAQQKCASCHALEQPDYEGLGIAERLQRQAPPLYFAGNKYREEWLLDYLQSPQTIHPGGYFPEVAMKVTSEGDMPDADTLHQHLSMDAAEAGQVTAFLMSLQPHDELLADDSYVPATVALRMAQMDFRKFKGCDACHQDAPGEGGFSGPQLYDAWQRLQPGYLSSFIQNPVAWDPNTTMPVPQMNEAAVHKLVNYLKLTGEEK